MELNQRQGAAICAAVFLFVMVGAATPAFTYEVFDNAKLRFGTGAQASVNTNGNLEQPFYFDTPANQWYKLTFSNYPLDNAIGVDGAGTNEWNLNGTIVQNSALAGQVLDVSGFTVTSGSKGYGTIVSTGTVTINGKALELRNTYTLGANQSFIKIVTRLRNISGSTIGNVRVWVGTRDDWVGTSDGPTKKRGNLNLTTGAFTAIANSADRAAALEISSGASGVLFYSTSPKAHTSINSCCSFSNAYQQNPATSAIQLMGDGSYALFIRMADLADGDSEEFTWYYAAGELSDLEEIVEDVAEEAQKTVTASAGSGGTISPSSAQVVDGATTAFTVAADTGYDISSVQGCGGTLVGNTYTTGPISSDCTVTASFVLRTYPVTASAGTGGSIGPTNETVNHGSTTTFTVTPSAGYSIGSVQGCGGALTGNTYTTGVITAACAVTASFTLNSYSVTVEAGAGGSVSPPNATIDHGSSTSFTVVPAVGYSIANVQGCGGMLNGNTYATGVITAACTVSASFAPVNPVFDPVSPPVYNLDSAALLTELPQSVVPRAFDFNGAELSVTLVGGQTHFAPGEYTLTWRATDDRGVTATVQQVLRVWPIVSMGPDVSLGFLEGNSAALRIVLNGGAPQVPFAVAYTVGGHLTGHDLESGSVAFAAGETEKEILFAITETPAGGTPAQEIEVELDAGVNLGARHGLTIHLLPNNAAPVVMLAASQGGEFLPVFGRDNGPVTISTDIRDPNSADTHAVEWVSPGGASVSVVNGSLVLQANSLAAGIHRFEAVVTDSGTPSLSTRGVLDIVLAETETALPEDVEDWADNGLPDDAEYSPPLRNVLPERAHDLTQFLIESDPGLHLSLGAHALQEERFQAELHSNSIDPDTVTNVGGYFDFIVSDLPAVGQSVNIVIPQRAQIPANPVYRKYNLVTQRWNSFVENSNNALASAPGAQGQCPPPGSDVFRAGLNPGDWCVRLTLSDGGPNDADGQENGVVADPGGVGALSTVVVTTQGKGGGGLFDPLLLLLGGVLLLMRRQSRGALLAAAVMAGSTAASADDAWYGGLRLGPARGDVRESDVNARLAGAGYDATATFTDLDRDAWRIFAGYRLSPRVGIEAGYTNLGEVRTQLEGNVADIEEFLASANELHAHSARGFELSVHGRYPLTQRISLGARGGLLRWESRYRARNDGGGEIDRLREDGTGAFLGVSVDFAVYRNWSLGIDWTNYRIDHESIGFTGFGLSYRIK